MKKRLIDESKTMIIRKYFCDSCDLKLKTGFGEYRYVIDDDGKVQKLQHPGEMLQIQKVLGKDASDELIDDRTGYRSYYVCQSCVHQFEAERYGDPDCPECDSDDVMSQNQLVGESCPRCKAGTIVSRADGVA